MITREHTQESLSQAYVHALAGVAGLNLAVRTNYDYGIDGAFHPVRIVGGARVPSAFPVEYQMKATTDWRHYGEFVVYDLDARAHRFLTNREPRQAMAILILLCLPPVEAHWLNGCEEHLRLRNCCYWFRPAGPPTINVSSVRIRIPRANVLTPDALRGIMALARAEGSR
ncbi:DUF4365 domain-containing protein [Methylobacterium sp. 88A]|uniref:DUF4365 domain-containing protein n=1 Tax=Methylobacterium sp. 88A TaxID=1131813 RepID=UPI000374061D|nr:DUF4365 domain-containing protein [Methylobacterium sp. 88A]